MGHGLVLTWLPLWGGRRAGTIQPQSAMGRRHGLASTTNMGPVNLEAGDGSGIAPVPPLSHFPTHGEFHGLGVMDLRVTSGLQVRG